MRREGGRMDEAKTLQTPTSGQFFLPASGFLLHVNVNMHRAELSLLNDGRVDDEVDGRMAQRYTLRGLLPGSAACV